eukprot:8374024-Alexandrium_andersonii.AAC.1
MLRDSFPLPNTHTQAQARNQVESAWRRSRRAGDDDDEAGEEDDSDDEKKAKGGNGRSQAGASNYEAEYYAFINKNFPSKFRT